jgi:hypothetical protein
MMTVSRQIALSDVTPIADFTGYIANNWYLPDGIARICGGGAPAANSIRLHAGIIKQKCTLSALGLRISTLSAGGNIQCALYANNAATGRPTGNALASTSSITTASTGSVNGAVSVQVDPGLYWFATNNDNGVVVGVALDVTGINISALIGSATQGNILVANGTLVGLSVPQTFGTWPDLTSASFTELASVTTMPVVQFKVASIP